jgi:hypothetical protein
MLQSHPSDRPVLEKSWSLTMRTRCPEAAAPNIHPPTNRRESKEREGRCVHGPPILETLHRTAVVRSPHFLPAFNNR